MAELFYFAIMFRDELHDNWCLGKEEQEGKAKERASERAREREKGMAGEDCKY